MNAAKQLLDHRHRIGVFCLGGQVLVYLGPPAHRWNPGTPARKRHSASRGMDGHRLRKAKRLEPPPLPEAA